MTVFDVFINGRKVCRAGVGADGVLSAIVNWVRLTGPAARTARRTRQPIEESRIHVGGLRGDEHRTWLERDLFPGDRVSIHVVKAPRADSPTKRTPRRPHGRPGSAYAETTFLNVDLDLWSRTSLEPLVRALGASVVELFVGRDGGRHAAHLEWARLCRDQGDFATTRRHVARARELVNETGYGRREREVRWLEGTLAGG